MSCVKFFPNQNVQERLAYNTARCDNKQMISNSNIFVNRLFLNMYQRKIKFYLIIFSYYI